MKTLFALALFLALAATAFAQPDPRDSVILESKTVAPGAGPGYVTIKVWITNKDTLTLVSLSLVEQCLVTSCGGYLTLAHPRTFDGVVNRLTGTLDGPSSGDFSGYNSSSPDSFRLAAGFDPGNPASVEPPNSVRKLLWEIKFDTAFAIPQIVELNSGTVGAPTSFVSTVPGNIPVNFVASYVTVDAPSVKGDLNLDCEVKTSDVVRELQCVFLGNIPVTGSNSCDLNCDGQISPSDAVVILNYVFLAMGWPC